MTRPGRTDLAEDRSLHRDVEAYIVGLIREGRIQPGDRISEPEVARQLSISRTPVREAFVRLIKDGVLVHTPRRGVSVAYPSRAAMEEIATLRAVLEGFAARLAVERIEPGELDELRNLIAEGVAAGRAGDGLTMEQRNAEFHDLLVASARHALLLRFWSTLSPFTWKLTPAVKPGPLVEAQVRSFEERHLKLIEAIASGDPQHAQAVASEHVERATDYMLAHSLSPRPEVDGGSTANRD